MNVSTLIAQSGEYLKGYIITNNQDTISGYVQDDLKYKLSNQINFKTKLQQASPVVYTPSELTSVFFEPSFFLVSKVFVQGDSTVIRFARKLVDGYATLYEYAMATDQILYLIIKENGEQIQLDKPESFLAKDQKYIGKLKYIFRDCPKMANLSYQTVPYQSPSLTEQTIRYNQCVKPEIVASDLNIKTKTKVNYGLV
ncbi:MAG: hypothetical protein HC892_08280, partial [Saprospiraceae bacterium]|nr:hypothetical protein [Saprospiraceae bacterium]